MNFNIRKIYAYARGLEGTGGGSSNPLYYFIEKSLQLENKETKTIKLGGEFPPDKLEITMKIADLLNEGETNATFKVQGHFPHNPISSIKEFIASNANANAALLQGYDRKKTQVLQKTFSEEIREMYESNNLQTTT